MAESSRRYNLRDTRKKPQGVLLKRWEVEYSNLTSNDNRRIPLDKVKTAIRSAFEDGMFEQWRITLKCPLSGQRIREPARYVDCTHIECFDLEAFLRMKTQKNLRVCPICQKEVEKPLANLRIDEYIETVLSTLPDAMQVELLPDGSFTEVLEEFVVEPNVINDEEPFVQDNNASAVDIKQEALENDDEYITLSDNGDEYMEDIVEIKPISLIPLNIDIKPKLLKLEIASYSEPEQTHSVENQVIQDQQNNASQIDSFDSQKESPSHKKRIRLANACESSIGDPKKRRVLLNDNQSAGPSADANDRSDQSSDIYLSSDSSGDENDESRIMTNENDPHRNPTTSTDVALNGPSDPAQEKKMLTLKIDIIYGTATFQTSDGKYYPYRPLSEYVSILRESEADVDGCVAHIIFGTPSGKNVRKAELRDQSVFGSQEKFKKFSHDIHSISHLWGNGRISVDLYQYLDNAKALLSPIDFCAGLFSLDRSILKCKVLEINWLHISWPNAVVENAVHNCKQLIFKIKPLQKLHHKFLDILCDKTLPQHVDVTIEFDKDANFFMSDLESRFRLSRGQVHYFKFKLLSVGFPRNKLLRNDYGTLETKIVASHHDDNGLRRDTVIIEQRPHTSIPDQLSSDPAQKMLSNVPNDSAQKKKITTITINISYGTASIITSEGQKYDDLPLSDYLPILRESDADVHGCQAHIVFRIWTELRLQNVLSSKEKFEKFSQDIHSISHLWEDGRIFVELYQYLDDAKTFLSIYDVYKGLFSQDRSILKCKILEIKCLNNKWPLSVITNVAHHCEQLIFKQEPTGQNMGQTFLDILYTVTLPRHLEVTLEIDINYNGFEYDFIDQLEKFTRNKLLRNDYGTLEMTKVALHRDYRGFYRDTVIIEQRPRTSVLNQQ